MRLNVSLILAAVVLHARAATIHKPAISDLEKKLPTLSEDVKDVAPAENVSSEQELIDSANNIKDIENNLRVKAIDSIPVSVIVEGDVGNPTENEVSSDVKRVPIDLNNTGEPQRQEHETQNAVHYNHEQQIVTSVKQTVIDTQNALRQGFQGITQGFQSWIANNEQLSAIQASINNLQENFAVQINKLNSTIQSFWNNRVGPNPPGVETTDTKPQMENVESQLKLLENNFKTGVKALSEGVEVFATLKAENENPSAPTPTAPNNLLVQYLQLFQNTLTQGFNNVTHALQNYVGQNSNGSGTGLLQGFNNGIQNIFNPTTPSGVQSDEGSNSRPTIWQGIQSSIQNILNPGQTQGQNTQGGQNTVGGATPNRPIAQAIQNLPFVQGVVNLIQPNKPAAQQPEKPADPAPAPAPIQEGSNVVPLPAGVKPESEVKEPAKVPVVASPEQPPKSEEPANNNGPIKNMITNNPIVQGISGAVQRLQATINNPEKPREEPEKVYDKEDTKGYKPGYNNNNTGDNNDSSRVGPSTKTVPEKPEHVEEPIPEVFKLEDIELPVKAEKTDKS